VACWPLSLIKSLHPQFGHYVSVKLGELQASSGLSEIFGAQLAILQSIEEADNLDKAVDAQVTFSRRFKCVCGPINGLTSSGSGERFRIKWFSEHTMQWTIYSPQQTLGH
jgi:hypothetical protein